MTELIDILLIVCLVLAVLIILYGICFPPKEVTKTNGDENPKKEDTSKLQSWITLGLVGVALGIKGYGLMSLIQ